MDYINNGLLQSPDTMLFADGILTYVYCIIIRHAQMKLIPVTG